MQLLLVVGRRGMRRECALELRVGREDLRLMDVPKRLEKIAVVKTVVHVSACMCCP